MHLLLILDFIANLHRFCFNQVVPAPQRDMIPGIQKLAALIFDPPIPDLRHKLTLFFEFSLTIGFADKFNFIKE
jgi:hypothetical protein